METLKREFGEYKDWIFTLTEDIRQTYTMNMWDSISKLVELEKQYNNIPAQIEQLNQNRDKIKEHYNEWLLVLQEAKENYAFTDDDLTLPSALV
jgi:flagellar biosynthesis chaperone FliJ